MLKQGKHVMDMFIGKKTTNNIASNCIREGSNPAVCAPLPSSSSGKTPVL